MESRRRGKSPRDLGSRPSSTLARLACRGRGQSLAPRRTKVGRAAGLARRSGGLKIPAPGFRRPRKNPTRDWRSPPPDIPGPRAENPHGTWATARPDAARPRGLGRPWTDVRGPAPKTARGTLHTSD